MHFSDPARLKETACAPEWRRVTTGKSYHSFPHWMVFTQMIVYESVQYKWSAFGFLFNGSLYGEKTKMSVIIIYTQCTGKVDRLHMSIPNNTCKSTFWRQPEFNFRR